MRHGHRSRLALRIWWVQLFRRSTVWVMRGARAGTGNWVLVISNGPGGIECGRPRFGVADLRWERVIVFLV